MVPIQHLDSRMLGKVIVVISDHLLCAGLPPAGVLIDVHKRYFRIQSPTTGQILCINYCDCLGFTTARCLSEDIKDIELQGHPEDFSEDFIPSDPAPEKYTIDWYGEQSESHRREYARRISTAVKEPSEKVYSILEEAVRFVKSNDKSSDGYGIWLLALMFLDELRKLSND